MEKRDALPSSEERGTMYPATDSTTINANLGGADYSALGLRVYTGFCGREPVDEKPPPADRTLSFCNPSSRCSCARRIGTPSQGLFAKFLKQLYQTRQTAVRQDMPACWKRSARVTCIRTRRTGTLIPEDCSGVPQPDAKRRMPYC